MAPAATTAAFTACAGAATAFMTLLGAAGTAGWFLAGFNKMRCPACNEKLSVRDFPKHAKNHDVECALCKQTMALPDLAEHVQCHGYKCPVCSEFVSFRNMEQHVGKHGYPCPRCKKTVPLAEMESHFQIHMAEEDEYNRRRQEVATMWGFLQAQCPICKKSVCLRDLTSHCAIHWMQSNANATRQESLVNMQSKGQRRQNRVRGLKIHGLVCPRTSIAGNCIFSWCFLLHQIVQFIYCLAHAGVCNLVCFLKCTFIKMVMVDFISALHFQLTFCKENTLP